MGKESGAVNWKRVLILAGAVIAFTIGSGICNRTWKLFSILQPMAGSPFWLFLDLRLHFCITISTLQKQVRSSILNMGTTCTNIYCGKYEVHSAIIYSTVFCYMSFWVMIGGAASTLHQEYGLPTWAGAVILTILTTITVIGGLNSLVDAIGVVGPIIVVLCIFIGLVTCIQDGGNVAAGLDVIKNSAYAGAEGGETIKNAGANWFISAASYAGFVLFVVLQASRQLLVLRQEKRSQLRYYRRNRCSMCGDWFDFLCSDRKYQHSAFRQRQHLCMEC